jgi:UDP-N-acetyl-2-amino-2-deoxyglucuronate dehydrogenase
MTSSSPLSKKKLRYGVIGLKGIGRRHFQTVLDHKQCDLVAVADIDEALARKVTNDLGITSYTDYRDMIEKESLDVVSIATPHNLHSSIGLDCLESGAHVLMEKPLAVRVSEADLLIETARRKGLKIGVCHQCRTFRASQTLKNLIDSGSIGNIMRVLWSWGHLRQQSYYDLDPWRGTFAHAGGGILMSQASHDLDLICWLFGKPVQVTALIANQLHPIQVEDTASVQVRFANGALGSFQFTLNQPKGYSTRQISGDRGVLMMPNVQSLWGDENDEILLGKFDKSVRSSFTEFTDSKNEPNISWNRIPIEHENPSPKGWLERIIGQPRRKHVKKKQRPHPLDQLVNNFIDAVLTGNEPLVSGESAHATIEVINAIYLSAFRGKTVNLPIDRDEFDLLFQEMSKGTVQVPSFR